jgi:hypothetical protein
MEIVAHGLWAALAATAWPSGARGSRLLFLIRL